MLLQPSAADNMEVCIVKCPLSSWGQAVVTHDLKMLLLAQTLLFDAEPAWPVPVFLHRLKQLTQCFVQQGPPVVTHVFLSLQAHAAFNTHRVFFVFFSYWKKNNKINSHTGLMNIQKACRSQSNSTGTAWVTVWVLISVFTISSTSHSSLSEKWLHPHSAVVH